MIASLLHNIRQVIEPDAEGAVPSKGFSAQLTLLTSAAMTFLAVFALALSLAAERQAEIWSSELAKSATLRISAPAAQLDRQTEIALDILSTTPGVLSADVLTGEEERALLEPWFGPDLPVDLLALPRLISVVENEEGINAANLRLRLAAEAPGAVFDDHTSWREPLVAAAGRLSLLAVVSLVIIGFSMAAMITLAANSALAANRQVITTLRLVGARDDFIRRAFVRRFARRAFFGGVFGVLIGSFGILIIPTGQSAADFLPGLRFQGLEWAWLLLIPMVAALVAYVATRIAATRTLGGIL